MSLGGAGVIGATGYGAYTLVQPKTIGEQLSWEGLTLLDVNSDSETDWTTLANKYPTSDSGDGSKKFSEDSEITGASNGDKAGKLKKKCEEIIKEELTSSNAGTNLIAAREWCTKKSVNVTASRQ